ncbi:hypothetical protein NHH03_05445 [Stieleria sp. TO1_6]|uniref:hypothetical protein n=1 Tax=Stieleria tagensis TaxID=2956795 RepID=UPI00209B8CFB|nr:hypothetical protein [Stieleria tagensis]MCO8121173.1 hypothetical protein [Stieleria tagensis]
MSRVFGLLLVGWITIGLTGCVGPMGAGCCGPIAIPGGQCGGGCDSGCDGGSCGGCDSCSGCGELYVDPWINHPADCVDPCDSCGNYNGQSCGKCRSVFSGMRSLWGYRCGCAPGPVATTDRRFAPLRSAICGGCDGGCDSCMGEPACGIEPNCGLEQGYGFEPACGCEGACDCSIGEPACGLEPACGCEGGCSCGGGVSHGYPVDEYPVDEGEYILQTPGQNPVPIAEKPYAPSRTRKIFNPRTASSGGFLNNHRR